jgi:hypothetical protein
MEERTFVHSMSEDSIRNLGTNRAVWQLTFGLFWGKIVIVESPLAPPGAP